MSENIVNLETNDKFLSLGGDMLIKRCVRFNRNLYCFNKGNNDVTVYREQTYKLNECPQDVISAFIKNEYDINIVIDEDIQEGKND
jgi:hypothetical protein